MAAGAIALLAACRGSGPPDDSATPDDSVEESEPPPEGLFGVLVDSAGQPIAEEYVLACTATACAQVETDAAGRFLFDITPPVELALKAHEDLDRSPRRAAALEPCRVVDAVSFDVDTLFAPDLPQGTPIDDESTEMVTIEAGDGLELTFTPANLTPAFGDRLRDVAATRLPDEHLTAFEAMNPGVIAVYALHPFGATSSAPIAVRAPSTLVAGSAVSFRTLSELDGTVADVVAGHADGEKVGTDAGGITRLSYLVITAD